MEPTAIPATDRGSTPLVRPALWRKGLMVLATVAVLLGLGACLDRPGPDESLPREPGCVTPPNEDALLGEYAADAIVTFAPNGARRSLPIQRRHGCLRWPGGDVSHTSVTTIFELSGDYGRADVRAAYAAVTAEHDWAPDRLRQTAVGRIHRTEGPDMQTPFLAYCRQVRGVTTEASITVQPATPDDPGPGGRVRNGQMAVWIDADPHRANCQTPAPHPLSYPLGA